MNKKKQVVTLFAALLIIVSFMVSAPMALFYFVEGGGGTPPPPTYPKTWQTSVIVSDPGSWSDDRYAAWAQIETEEHILSLRIVVSEKNDGAHRTMMQLSTFYTYKGERTHNWLQNDGVLCYMKIEVGKFGSYYPYMDGSWTTSETSRGCSPQNFVGFDAAVPWSDTAQILLGALIDVAMAAVSASTIAGLAVGVFTDIIFTAADEDASAPDPIRLGSDTTGYHIWPCFDTYSAYYYGPDFGPDGDGYQMAYDFSSHCELRTGWTTIPDNGYQGWKFRAVIGVEDVYDTITITTPWVYVGIFT